MKAHEAALCADEGIEVKFADAADPPGHCIKTSPPVPGDAFASVTIEPPTMATACRASEQFTPPPLGGAFARACPWTGEYRTGFDGLVCIAPEHDGSCRPGFSARFEFQEKIRDARTCTPCECGEPVGGICVADVLLFSDTTCSDMLISINGIGMEEEICYGAPADSPLAGVRVVFARDEPGTCSPTTTVSLVDGTIESGEARTFCCSSAEIIYGNVDN
ncbi:hypothetical protein AB3662_31535 [Sorangium cellulosum]|uniref:hypothetical protein n=1 Tax=Sorangium cellulosum TaxID=56 RepID=UPI003D9A17EE